ncbi:hypothetical protein UPYG_G00130510 [Umbra pygmaea]|uniref:Anti-proliferative protein domain-containing protein n=1 Tax=Umbra pygmaea TaxID=75934 RepID=A0ABD0XAF6_UMBPY
MKEEIAAAVFFVARLVKRHGSLETERRDRFSAALTSALFENYKSHWYPQTPLKGQAYRCLRMNRAQRRDPVLESACLRSSVPYEGLGLPLEITIWVDPGEVSCRYGEHSIPFCVTQLQGCRRGDREFSRRIHEAVERANSDIQSGSSSDEEGGDTSISSSSCHSALCTPLVSAPPPPLSPKQSPQSVTPTASTSHNLVSLHQSHLLPPGHLTPRGRPSLGTATHLSAPPLEAHSPSSHSVSSILTKTSSPTEPPSPSLDHGRTSTTGSARAALRSVTG